jgi:hypothetical protein
MIEVKLTCSFCSKERDIHIPSIHDRTKTLQAVVTDLHWISEQNEKYHDTYCCEKCAKGKTKI